MLFKKVFSTLSRDPGAWSFKNHSFTISTETNVGILISIRRQLLTIKPPWGSSRAESFITNPNPYRVLLGLQGLLSTSPYLCQLLKEGHKCYKEGNKHKQKKARTFSRWI